MHSKIKDKLNPVVTVEIADTLMDGDLSDLCEVTEYTINSGGGFGWLKAPSRQVLERYWFGVLTVPERNLIIARVDGIICGAVQLVEPSKHNQAQHFSANLLAVFVAPWARGHNIGMQLLKTAENLALEKGYAVLNLDVRETQATAIQLVESLDYKKWGENPFYAKVGTSMVKGLFYSKLIDDLDLSEGTDSALQHARDALISVTNT